MDYVEELPLPTFWRLLRSLAKRPAAARVARWQAGIEGDEGRKTTRASLTDETAAAAAKFLGIEG